MPVASVVLDNVHAHKPKHDRWLRRHPNAHFHFTPTHASWLDQIEIWFSIMTRAVLNGASFTHPGQICQGHLEVSAARRNFPLVHLPHEAKCANTRSQSR